MNDPKKKFEMNEDLIYIEDKIYGRNIIKLGRLTLIIFCVIYFVGQYWIIFVQISQTSKGSHQQNEYELLNDAGSNSFLSNDNWDISSYNGLESTAFSLYFALTSLSTTGFGDLYPVTDFERIAISFILLIGVAIFSLHGGKSE